MVSVIISDMLRVIRSSQVRWRPLWAAAASSRDQSVSMSGSPRVDLSAERRQRWTSR